MSKFLRANYLLSVWLLFIFNYYIYLSLFFIDNLSIEIVLLFNSLEFFFLSLIQLQEEHQKALLRRDFQLQSLDLQARLQQKLWNQERTLLVQESQHLKQALLLLSLKLRCFLKQWRLGCKKDAEWKDVLEVPKFVSVVICFYTRNTN